MLRSQQLQILRLAKHRAAKFLFDRRLHPVWFVDRAQRLGMRHSFVDMTRPFDREELRRTFLIHDAASLSETRPVPRRVFVFWMSDFPMYGRYLQGLESLRRQLHVPIALITRETLGDWVLPGHALPDAFWNLSAVHQSDYLRAYMMHHHGGGYCDLKKAHGSWFSSFQRFDEDPQLWMLGAPNYEPFSGPDLHPLLERRVRQSSRHLTLQAAFICRPWTSLTAEWLAEVHRLLRYYEDLLEEFPGAVRDEVVLYPVPWTRLLSQVLHPLQYKYLDHVATSSDLGLDMSGY